MYVETWLQILFLIKTSYICSWKYDLITEQKLEVSQIIFIFPIKDNARNMVSYNFYWKKYPGQIISGLRFCSKSSKFPAFIHLIKLDLFNIYILWSMPSVQCQNHCNNKRLLTKLCKYYVRAKFNFSKILLYFRLNIYSFNIV